MIKKEQLKMILASYFKYWGADVAEVLDNFRPTEQRRIVHEFMAIVEEDDFIETNDSTCLVLTRKVAQDIERQVESLVKLYYLDKLATDTVKVAINKLTV